MVALKAGVIGHPIGQSLSPILHSRWIAAFGLDASYEAIDSIDETGFKSFVSSMEQNGFAGLNVTIPFKRVACEVADELTETAQHIGAVNLLICREGRLIGDNTDAYGFRAALESMALDPAPRRARVLGAGGAAPAIVVALKQAGVEDIEITNRSPEKAMLLSDQFEIKMIDWGARDQDLDGVDLLVNTTSLGMKGQPELVMDMTELPSSAGVIDIITTPAETALLAAARKRGHTALNGLPMLVHQAVPSFEAWFGHRPHDGELAIRFLEQNK